MSNNRKTQGDIDKLIKKISEGIEEYETLYDKFAEAPNAALKERFEGDLKKEIKKLQRHRENVKALIQNPEVKDKKALETARRRVEEKMEAFKVVERETKTKTFSKEGLANLTNNACETPQQRTENWIKVAISDLKEQIETAEFELQAEGGGGGSRGRKGAKKEDPREVRLTRLRFHTLKLEQLLRLVVNEDLEPDEVDEIEDEVQRYIEENAEDDFEEREELYDAFDLPDVPIVIRGKGDSDDEDASASSPQQQPTPSADKKGSAKSAVAPAAATPVSAPKPAASAAAAPAAKVTVAASATPPTTAAKAPATPATAKAATQPQPAAKKSEPATPASSPLPAAATPTTPATPFAGKKSVAAVVAAAAAPAAPAAKTPMSNPPIALGSSAAKPAAGPTSFAAAAAAAAGVKPPTASNSTPALPAASIASPPVASNASSASPLFPATATPTMSRTASSAMAPTTLSHVQQGPTGLSGYMDGDDALLEDDMDAANDDTFGDDAMPVVAAKGSLADIASATSSLQHEWEKNRLPPKQATSAATAAIAPPRTVESSPPSTLPSTPASQSAPAQSGSQTASVWSALLKGQQPTEEKVAMSRMLDMSLHNLPHSHDVERVRPFVPPNPYVTKPFFPQQVHPGFSTPEMFRRFESDTLFFIFYYQQQTYQQYLAAKELKRQSFRYHKKFKTWFQRHDKPKESTEEYESGAYLYFDYENGWCQRIKNDFSFKYVYLEDELV